jgi:SagB-type dehydrogenase family enzyme
MEESMSHLNPTTGSDAAMPVFEIYHENSKQRRNDLDFNRRVHYLTRSTFFHQILARTFKTYPGTEVVSLPRPKPSPGPGFEHTVVLRRSIRRFTGDSLELAELARLLLFGCGLTGQLQPAGEAGSPQPVRAAPSAGAVYPVEIYLVVSSVKGLDAGIYHYSVDRHVLELLRVGTFGEILASAASDPATFTRAAVAFVITGMFGRSHFKYGERAYRFTLLEAGHICQNLLLAVTELGLGAVPVGGFIDEEVNALIDLDGVDEAALYLVAVGRRARHPGQVSSAEPSVIERLLSSLWQEGSPAAAAIQHTASVEDGHPGPKGQEAG